MKPVLCIMGPTAAGKSALALSAAGQFGLEIVNVDSALVYRGMDIGTSKPSPAERSAVPHHLIDLIDPADNYSAAQFRADALRLIQDIRARGREPLLVGGTMLYFKALRDGLDQLPGADPLIRARLEQEAAEQGWPALHARLQTVDPTTALRLPPTDAQRIQRALEIFQVTGQPMSSLFGQRSSEESVPLTCISLEPGERSALHTRIAERFDAMLAQGLIDEVEGLRKRGDLHPELPSMRCVGYRQTWAYLEGHIGRNELRQQGIAATRQLAKRQLTWLRAMPERNVLDCFSLDTPTHAKMLIQTHMDQC